MCIRDRFKNGQPFKMSKRKGDYITVDDLINEVGKDATRFIMLNRSSDAELDFDFDNVIEKSKDNPLYYVQYCYARIASVFRYIDKNLKSDIKIDKYDFEYSKDEIDILKKISFLSDGNVFYLNNLNNLIKIIKSSSKNKKIIHSKSRLEGLINITWICLILLFII